ncbi:protein lap1 isoform X2 [Ixodes scapularis]|uniref:protein lap1 isoform X2 n=1 Tax=Ixodes scapularis TaxID=6945 RepID=UPI001AA00C50|nr:protein lap1 isoform X2 [Ixodes scapularis]
MGMGPVFRHCPCLRPAREEVRVLDYAHCGLEEVPSEVFNYERTLEELYLNANQIKDLPRPLFHCHGLRKLNLSDNDIQTLPPALSSLVGLEELDISKNNVIEIPDNIKGCKCLSIVEASVNPVGKLPEGFTQLINIEQLYLNDTFLEYLPANFGRLSKLKILELRENHLKVLPKSMARLTELVRLDIGQNDFAELPEVIGSLPSLTELWCDNNRLTALPSYLGNLVKLTYLDASRNRISYVAEEIEHLAVLSDLTLTANKLQKVPETLGCLQSLTTLRLDDNHLATLPDSIGQLCKLEELIINGNEIDSLPSTVGLLRSLSILIADDNLLEDLPPEIGSCGKLRVLSLRDNRLCNVPDELGHLGALRVVNLSGNQLRHLPVSLAKLGGLHALWLSQNQTKPLVLLQSDLDRETGQRVLTCFLLPQESPSAHGEKPDVVEDDSSVVPGERRGTITFAFDVDVDRPGRLVRSPTPYPKELKARARHVRNLRRQMNGDVVGPGAVVVSQPTSRMEGFGRPEAAPLERTPPDPQVREAKVVHPSPPTTQDLAQVHVDTHDLTIRHRDASLATAEEYPCRQTPHNMFTTTNNNIAMCTDLETVKSLASQPCQSPPLSSIVTRNPAPSPDLHQLHHQHLQQHPGAPHAAAHQQEQQQHQQQLLLLQHEQQQQAHHHPAQPHATAHHPTPHQHQTLPRQQVAPHRASPQQQHHQASWEDTQRQYERGVDSAYQHHEPQHAAKPHPHSHPFEKFAVAGSRGSLVEKFQHRLVVSAEDSVDQQGYKSDQETYVQQPGKSGTPARGYHDGYSSDWDASATLPRGFSLSRPPDVVPGYFRQCPASPGRTLPRRGSSPVSPRMCTRSPRKMAAFAVQAPHPLRPAPAALEGAAEGAAPFLLPQYCGDLRTSKEGYSLPVRRGPPPADWAPPERLAPRAEDEDLAPSQSSSSLASSGCLPGEDLSLSSLNSVTPDSGPSPTTPCFQVPEEEEEEEEEAPPLPPRPRGDSSSAPVPPPKPDFLLQRSVSCKSADLPLVHNEVVLEKGSEVDFVLENRVSVPGVFVKEVNPRGVAAGKLEVGDKILRVDGLDVSSAEVNYALGALVSSGPKVRLIFARHQ